MTDERRPANHGDDDDYGGDRYFDLNGLSRYSSLSVATLRRYTKHPKHPLPHIHMDPGGRGQGRILVSKRAFDRWMEQFTVHKETDASDTSWMRDIN